MKRFGRELRVGVLLGGVCLGGMASALPMRAQGQPAVRKESATEATHFYHLVFVLKESEGGRPINSRVYNMDVATADADRNRDTRSIRTGTKVPVEVEAGKVTYVDVGFNIDCRQFVEMEGKLAMKVSAEVTSADTPRMEGASGSRGVPALLQNRWNSDAVVTLGKPTTLFSSDEVTSKRTLALELTATRLL